MQAYDRDKETKSRMFSVKKTNGNNQIGYVGALVLVALALLILIRLGFRGAVNVSGSAGIG